MPGPPTTPDNLPIITDTDSPDIPRDMNALANATQKALVRKGVPIFANATEANAWYTANGAPVSGMIRYLTTPGIYQTYSNGVWVWVYALAVSSATFSLAAGASQTLTWASAQPQPADTTPLVFSGTNVTIPKKGVYSLQATLVANLSVSGVTGISIRATPGGSADNAAVCAAGYSQILTHGIIRTLDANAVVTVVVGASQAGTISSATLVVVQVGNL